MGVGTLSGWTPFQGRPSAQPLVWEPTLNPGTYTGLTQAAWSSAATSDYTVLGGEFPRVNGTDQQGLVRFARRELTTKVDPIQGYTELTPTVTADGPGAVRLAWTTPWDRDNEKLTVEVLRGATTSTSTVIKTFTTVSKWWNRPLMGFVDKTAPAGSSQTYRIRVRDPFGNGGPGAPTTFTIPAGTPVASNYTDSVLADNPSSFWRMNDTGTTQLDRSGSNDLTIQSSSSRNQAGAMIGQTDNAVSFPGSSSTSTVQGATPFWGSGPQTFTLEGWVKTNTSSGGKILGFGDSNTGRSSTDRTDRHIYMNNSGNIYFGVRPDMGTRITINSPSTYRDNQWHYVAATLGADGMKLYVDGNQVAANAAVTKAQVYRGYWRVGGDQLGSWPSAPSREAIAANLDDLAVYPKALSLGRIRSHFLASGRTTVFANINPIAGFTSSASYTTASFDAATSTDDDGSIASYLWNFGDSTTGTGVTNTHTYASGGTYNVSLTVTDNRGGTNTITQPVTVINPPANFPPTASFTTSIGYHTAAFTSGSTDVDGTIVSSEWNFGDGNIGTGATTSHEYAAPGTYVVALSVTDNKGATTSSTNDVTITDQYAADTFGRTVTNALGTADRGGAWTPTASVGANFSVDGEAAHITGVTGANRQGFLQAVRQTDVDIKTDISINAPATGGGTYVYVVGRRVSTGNDYRLKVRYQADGSVVAYLAKTVGNTETIVAWTNVTGLTVSPGDVLRVRFQALGTSPTTLRAKVWRASGFEPLGWLVTGSDNTPAVLQAPGDLGIVLYPSGSTVGTPPALTFDNYEATPDSGLPVNVLPTAGFNFTTTDFGISATSTSSDPDGSIVDSTWSWGDGNTATGTAASHTYTDPGEYTVALTVTDSRGGTDTFTNTVEILGSNVLPLASFTQSSLYHTATVTSTSTDPDGFVNAYLWDFGDDSFGTGQSTDHTYATAGTYLVTLTVTDNRGGEASTSADVIVVDPPNVPPTASFTSSNLYKTATVTSTSTDSDGTIQGYSWNFGDSTTGSGASTSHTYAAAGTYPVTLTVTDDDGDSSSTTNNVTVTEPASTYASDLFSRTVSNGLGTADIGGAWTVSPAANFSVSGGVGRIVGTTSANRAAYLQAVRQTDYDIKGDISINTAASGGGAYVNIIGRRVSAGNDYRLKVRYQTGGVVVAYLARTVGNTETILANTTVTGLTANPGDVLRVRVQALDSGPNTTIRAKVWRAVDAEPSGWLLTNTAATPAALQAAGDTGVLLFTSSTWVGTAPTLTLDNFLAGADQGTIPNQLPTASFTSSVDNLSATLTSTSSDVDGAIVASAWDFGDSTSGSGAATSHNYAAAGTYTVTLTVTDNQGATSTTSAPVTVNEPPNVPPTAAFTSTTSELTANLTSTSTDSDGSIASSAWQFGDTTTGSGATTSHTYAAAGTYPVTLTVTDDDGATTSVTQNVTVSVTIPPAVFASDLFGRTVANGFGDADTGGAWTLQGTASNFSVDGSIGRIAGTVAANRAAYLTSVAQRDVEIDADVTLDSPATGGGAYLSVIGRRVSVNNDYRVKVRYQSTGTAIIYLVRNTAGTEVTLASATLPGGTVAAGEVLHVRFQVSGTATTTLRTKVWRGAATEPATWLVTTTDAAPAAFQGTGDVGVLLYTSGTWTGTAPVATVDNLNVGELAP